MARVDLAEHMREGEPLQPAEGESIGPFVTVSRQYGCWGLSLALLLSDILNELAPPGKHWSIFYKEMLNRLASETDLPPEVLDRQRRAKPSLLVDFFRSLSDRRLPSGFEVRNRITTIIRAEAIKGQAIILGQGGSAATSDLPNGLAVRLEAPEDWRVKQVAFREGVSETEARTEICAKERERDYLRKLYELRFPRKPPFHLVYDCSAFTLAQIAQQIVYAMKLKGMV